MPFTTITYEEMHNFLESRGFQLIYLPKVKELVYGKILAKNICLRVYTSIERDACRAKGTDAIRVVIVKRLMNGTIKPITPVQSRVNRTENWRKNLDTRIENTLTLYKESTYA